jgi:hypothetical protein
VEESSAHTSSELSGKWVDQWKSRLGWDAVLYIEEINSNSAKVVFSWGEYNTSLNSCHCNPNWVRVQKAKVWHSGNNVILDFYTPIFYTGKEIDYQAKNG